MVLSIIIPCYNSESTLPQCLNSILSQKLDNVDFEVIVVESGTPASKKSGPYPDKVIHLKRENQLFAGEARNLGAETARGEFLLFIDADITLSPGALNQAIDRLRSNPQQVIAAAMDVSPEDRNITSMTELFFEFSEATRFSNRKPRNWLPSYFLGLSTTEFHKQQGFSSLRSSQDVEFTWRLFRGGCQLALAHDILVFHRSQAGIHELFRKAYRFGRAAILLRRKGVRSQNVFLNNPQLFYFFIPFFCLFKLSKLFVMNTAYNFRGYGLWLLAASPLILMIWGSWAFGAAIETWFPKRN
jgi:glycosyltransferase involved in cell wall biosynthesis